MKFNRAALRAVIASSDLFYEEIASLIDVHPNTIGNWARGVTTPTPEKLMNLLTACGFNDSDIERQGLAYWYRGRAS
jgi:transcriptional regulator with XRE-family HTH domain